MRREQTLRADDIAVGEWFVYVLNPQMEGNSATSLPSVGFSTDPVTSTLKGFEHCADYSATATPLMRRYRYAPTGSIPLQQSGIESSYRLGEKMAESVTRRTNAA